MSTTRGALVLMTRRPEPGLTKTRLIPELGAEDAAQFHLACLGDLLGAFADVPVKWHCIAFADLPSGKGGTVTPPWEATSQVDGDLGARMQELWSRFNSLGPVVFIGADAPTLPPASVSEAMDKIDAGLPAVFQPALDGGFTLAAFGSDPAPLLTDIPWGTDQVLSKTLDRAATSGLRIGLLDPWYDVDTGRDFERLIAHLRVLDPAIAPNTRSLLRSLGRA